MRNSNKPPQTINLPPIVIHASPPPLPLPPSAWRPVPGHTAKPLPWNGNVVESAQLKKLFSQKNIRHPDQTITIVAAIANQQRDIEQAYNAHIPFLSPELDQEIVAHSDPDNPNILEKYKSQKTIIQKLTELKNSELTQNIATANMFYGRSPFDKNIKHNAVDFVNIFHRSRNPALTIYNNWLTSITAAYTARMLAATTKILAEKSEKLRSTIATTEAEEKQRYAATWTSRYNKEKSAIVDQYYLDKTSIEIRVQSQLDASHENADSTAGLTPEQQTTDAIRFIRHLKHDKLQQMQQHLLLLAAYPGTDFKNRDSEAFLERTRINGLDTELSFKQELAFINATYKRDILEIEIGHLENRLIKLVPEQERLIEERANSGKLPASPPDTTLRDNMEQARKIKETSKIMITGDAVLFGIFYTKVRNKGEWDYKQRGTKYEEFGNFNYGATGTAAGISEQILLRAAGAAQSVAGTSTEEFGKWWADSPYGDDNIDQIWIRAGIKHAKAEGF